MVRHGSVLSELIQGIGPMRYSTRYSEIGSQEEERNLVFVLVLISTLYSWKIRRARMLFFSSPQLPIHTDNHGHLLVCAELLGTEDGIIKVFPALSAGFMELLVLPILWKMGAGAMAGNKLPHFF